MYKFEIYKFKIIHSINYIKGMIEKTFRVICVKNCHSESPKLRSTGWTVIL